MINIKAAVSFFKRERVFLIINLSILALIAVILKNLPISEIELPLADSACLSVLENDNRISRQFPSLQDAGYAVFKRLKLDLPLQIKGEAPHLKIYARTTGNVLNYQLIINKQLAGIFTITKRNFFSYVPVSEEKIKLDGNRLKIILNFDKPATKTPLFFVKKLDISADGEKTIMKRNWSFIFSLFAIPFILVIILSLSLKNPWIKYLISAGSALIFFLFGLSRFPSVFALLTVLLPILAASAVITAVLFFLKGTKIIAVNAGQAGIFLIIFILGMTLWSILTFHPAHYHPDLKTHIYWGLSAFEQPIGDFSAEYSFFQMNVLLLINAPFPYSPSFYIAVKLLSSEPAGVIFWVRFLPILLTVLIAPLLYLTIRKISGSDSAGVWSSIAYLLSGIAALRILYFFCPALWGTFFITAAMLLICWRYKHYTEKRTIRYLLPEIAALTIGLLAYPAGPFTLGVFALSLLIFWLTSGESKKIYLGNWLRIFVPSFSAALFLYYIWFIPEIIAKVLPRMKEGAFFKENLETDPTIWSRFQDLLGTNVIIILGIAGFILLLIDLKNRTLRTVFASWGISWLFLFAVRFIPLAKTLFKFSKDELFLLPLLAVSLGYLTSRLWEGNLYKKILAAMVVCILIAGFYLKISILIPRLYIQ